MSASGVDEQQTFAQAELLRLWSVTTLIDMALGMGPGLVNWIVGQVAGAAIDKRATVEAMLRESGRDEAVKWLSDQRWAKSEKAKVRGTDVHAAAEAIALGIEPVIVPGTEPYVEQLSRWLKRWQPEYLLAECPVYNVERRYAGTSDGVMRLPGYDRPLIFDYKTTDKGPDAKSRPPYPEVALQLAAYARAPELGLMSEQRYDKGRRYYLYDPTQHHEPMPEIGGAICIVISPVDCFAVPVRIDDEVWRMFLHAQAVARFRSETSSRLFGGVLSAHEVTP